MAHQPLGGRPVAVVNPNFDRPGPLKDPKVSRIAHASLLIVIDVPLWKRCWPRRLHFLKKMKSSTEQWLTSNYTDPLDSN